MVKFRRLAGVFLVMGALLAPATASSAATVQSRAAAQPNSSLLFMRRGGTTAYGASALGGHYHGAGSIPLGVPHTNAVVSQDTALFYNETTGDATVGEIDAGTFSFTNDYTFSTGWTQLAAGCNTVFLLNTKTRSFAVGLLQGGAFVQKQSLTLNGATHIAASCNTLLTYNIKNGAGSTYKVAAGRINLSTKQNYSFSTGWTHITATRNSVLFYNAVSGSGAWGSLNGGTYVGRGSGSTFSKGFTAIGGTTDTLAFYKKGSTSVAFSQLRNGQYTFVGTVAGFSNNWDILTGGK